jgi:hypothetical protein
MQALFAAATSSVAVASSSSSAAAIYTHHTDCVLDDPLEEDDDDASVEDEDADYSHHTDCIDYECSGCDCFPRCPCRLPDEEHRSDMVDQGTHISTLQDSLEDKFGQHHSACDKHPMQMRFPTWWKEIQSSIQTCTWNESHTILKDQHGRAIFEGEDESSLTHCPPGSPAQWTGIITSWFDYPKDLTHKREQARILHSHYVAHTYVRWSYKGTVVIEDQPAYNGRPMYQDDAYWGNFYQDARGALKEIHLESGSPYAQQPDDDQPTGFFIKGSKLPWFQVAFVSVFCRKNNKQKYKACCQKYMTILNKGLSWVKVASRPMQSLTSLGPIERFDLETGLLIAAAPTLAATEEDEDEDADADADVEDHEDEEIPALERVVSSGSSESTHSLSASSTASTHSLPSPVEASVTLPTPTAPTTVPERQSKQKRKSPCQQAEVLEDVDNVPVPMVLDLDSSKRAKVEDDGDVIIIKQEMLDVVTEIPATVFHNAASSEAAKKPSHKYFTPTAHLCGAKVTAGIKAAHTRKGLAHPVGDQVYQVRVSGILATRLGHQCIQVTEEQLDKEILTKHTKDGSILPPPAVGHISATGRRPSVYHAEVCSVTADTYNDAPHSDNKRRENVWIIQQCVYWQAVHAAHGRKRATVCLYLDGPNMRTTALMSDTNCPLHTAIKHVPNNHSYQALETTRRQRQSEFKNCHVADNSMTGWLRAHLAIAKQCGGGNVAPLDLVWLDFCCTFKGSATQIPQEDILLLFKERMLANYSVLGLTFSVRDGTTRQGVSDAVNRFVMQCAVQNNYVATYLGFQSNKQTFFFLFLIRDDTAPYRYNEAERNAPTCNETD